MPTTPDHPAESILGPITPIRCTEPGCHWACHGVPDKYVDSRARIVREHVAAEHSPTPEPSPAAVWVEGDPLMEAMAAAVYEQCGTDAVSSIVVDDPRNIAAVAATVARQLLGTTTAEGTAEPTPAELIRDRVNERLKDCVWLTVDDEPMALAESWPDVQTLIDAIHTAAGLDGTEPAPADRAATLHEAAEAVDNTEFPDEYVDLFDNGARWASRLLRRLAHDAAAGVQPPTTGEADTLAPWLYRRFMVAGVGWDQLDEDDRSYWEHHARAVRRAVARGGFRTPATPPAAPAAPEEPTPC